MNLGDTVKKHHAHTNTLKNSFWLQAASAIVHINLRFNVTQKMRNEMYRAMIFMITQIKFVAKKCLNSKIVGEK